MPAFPGTTTGDLVNQLHYTRAKHSWDRRSFLKPKMVALKRDLNSNLSVKIHG